MSLPIHPVDVTVIAVFLAASVGVGVWLGRRQQNLDDFALGGRNLPWWALLGSIVATETSTATFLSVTGKPVFDGGDCRFLQLAFGYILGRWAVATILLPGYFQGRLFTAYQVLAERFGTGAQAVASVLFLITRNLGDGLRLYLCAIALEATLGFPLPACIVLIGVVTIAYTMCGGMKSVVWNDCIQFVIYMFGGLAALWVMIDALPGGWNQLMSFARENDKLRVFVVTPPEDVGLATWLWRENYTLAAGLLGGMVLSFGTHGVDQMMVQRYLCARSQRDAARAVIVSGFVVLGQFAFFLFVGVALSCFLTVNAAPEWAQSGDRVFSWFIVTHMPVGLTGLTLAAVFAAAMSTLSSSLSASATAVIGDFEGSDGARAEEAGGRKQLLRTRLWTLGFGLVQIAIALGAAHVSKSVVDEALAIAGFTAGVLLGVFLLGLRSRQATQAAAIIGMACGVAVLLYARLATDLAGMWYALTGAATTMVAGLVASRFGRKS